jgi:hypothetical protein
VLSEEKSPVSPGGLDKKHGRATFGMVRITNLNHSPGGNVDPFTPHLLMCKVCHGDAPGKGKHLYAIGTTAFNQKEQGLQEPKPNTGGTNGILAWPKVK